MTADLLGRDAVLNADDIKTEDVPVPEWGGVVRVRALTGAQRDAYEQSLIVQRGNTTRTNLTNARAKLVALCVVDADGSRLFADDDARRLGDKSAGALSRVFDCARRLSGLTEEDLEELVEGFGSAPNGASTSG